MEAGKEYEIKEEEGKVVLYVHADKLGFLPLLEEDERMMAFVNKILMDNPSIDSVVIISSKVFSYPPEQIHPFRDFFVVVDRIINQDKIIEKALNLVSRTEAVEIFSEFVTELELIFKDRIFADPIGSFVTLRRLYFFEKARKVPDKFIKYQEDVILILKGIVEKLSQTSLIKEVERELPGLTPGKRDIYRKILKPIIRPLFIKMKIIHTIPEAEEIESYSVGKAKVMILRRRDKARYYYFIFPEESFLFEKDLALIDEVRDIIIKHKLPLFEYLPYHKLRALFYDLAQDLLNAIIKDRGLNYKPEEIDALAKILVKLTVGFGPLEDILQDENIEDVYINPPAGENPIIVKHSKYGEMETNIFLHRDDILNMVSKLKLISGRPLDEAHPVLDCDFNFPFARVRFAVVRSPLSPKGIGIAIRRHRARPWTFPLLIDNGTMSPLAAAVIWLLVDGGRTFLIAGTRGAGKTSFLSALMCQILRRYRIITIEDTLELPVDYLRKLGYNILSLKVRSAIVGSEGEMSAEEGIRTSLRLGDSCLIIGEVRSLEARALYESMRIGAMANVVAGTIHGESAYSVYDRVVNDLGVAPTSFKATDIIIILNKIRTPGGLVEKRRVVDITEVTKEWTKDPLLEGGFVQLFRYDAKKDVLEPTRDLLEGESVVLKSVAARVKEWVGKWDKLWQEILVRKEVLEYIVDLGRRYNKEILEADCVVELNDIYHLVREEVSGEFGELDREELLKRFKERALELLKRKGLI